MGIPVEGRVFLAIRGLMSYIGDTVVFLYGPLLYLYARRLLFLEKEDTKQWRYFIPAAVFFIVNVTFQYLGEGYLGRIFFDRYYAIVAVLAFLHLYYFLFRSTKTVMAYKTRSSQELSFKPSVNYLLTIIGVVALALLAFFMDFLQEQFSLNTSIQFLDYNHAWLLTSFMTFILVWFAVIKPGIFRFQGGQVGVSKVDSKELEALKGKLMDIMTSKKLYLNPELSLHFLAQELDTRKELISKVLNQGLSKNFYQFVNEYRVAAFKQLIDQKDHTQFTLHGLALAVGFKSKTTFYKAFKEITGQTPSQYLRSLI